jgi:hypothetical protein
LCAPIATASTPLLTATLFGPPSDDTSIDPLSRGRAGLEMSRMSTVSWLTLTTNSRWLPGS